jgi:PAS domain S-box-containing protein
MLKTGPTAVFLLGALGAVAFGPDLASCQEPIPIRDVLLDEIIDWVPDRLGDTVVVDGVVITPPGMLGEEAAAVYLQDRTAGIALFTMDPPSLMELARGDSIRVAGIVAQYRGGEFLFVQNVERLGVGEEPEPVPLVVAEAKLEPNTGHLVALEGVLRARADDGGGWAQAELEDRTGTIPVVIPPHWLTDPAFVRKLDGGRTVEVIGVIGQSTGAVPPRDGYHLFPRSADDIQFAPVPPYAAMGAVALAVVFVGLIGWRRSTAKRARELEALSDELATSRNQLREREARLRSLVENAADTVSIVDTRGTVLYQSPSVERLLGWTPSDLVGTQLGDLVGPDDRDALLEFLESVAREESATREIEVPFRTKSGDWRRLEMIGTSRLDDPAVRGIVCNSRDVTDHRALEHRVRHADRLEVVGRLAGGIAHDFNNVLTALRGHAEMALAEIPAGADGHADIEEVVRSADRAASLTRQLLAFSRQQVLKPTVVDPREIVLRMLPMIRRLIGEQIRLDTMLQTGTAPVRVDAAQFEQVVMNLVVNARDAMPDGGRLILELADDRISAAGAPGYSDPIEPGAYVRLTVTDDGHGMSEEVLRHIFEPFFTTKAQGKGTGLGLATLYGIVKQSGGHVRARSSVGKGSRFDICFPAVDEPVPPAPPANGRAVPAREAGGRVVLLVEDEMAVRRLTRRVLEKNAYTVLEAATPAVALDIARRHEGSIDLLLTDVVMPGMSGPDLADALKAQRADIPVLFTSGYTDDEVVRHGVVAGGARFLEKPFSTEQLLLAVQAALPGS